MEGEQLRQAWKSRRRFQMWLGALLVSLILVLSALVISALLREPGGALAGANPLDGAIRLIALMLVGVGVFGVAAAWLVLTLARERPSEHLQVPLAFVERLTEDIVTAAARAAVSERQH